MSTLYIVSTPIGNLEDISPRAIETLKNVHTILAEDTRRTLQLVRHFQLTTRVISYHQHSKLQKIEYILDLLQDHDMALVSDAGTPGISDPGYQLISKALEQNVRIVPIPGPTACISLAICSGFDLERFVFLGFLPRKSQAQRKTIEQYLTKKCPLILYESPYRLVKTLTNLQSLLGKRQIVVGRELTKKFEEFIRGDAATLIQKFSQKTPRGEITIIIS